MSSSRESWEGWAESWEWERLGPHDHRFWDDTEDLDYNGIIDPEVASTQLVDMLVRLKRRGILSAQQTCILAWWSHKAGAAGSELSQLGMRPDKDQTGKYSEHFD